MLRFKTTFKRLLKYKSFLNGLTLHLYRPSVAVTSRVNKLPGKEVTVTLVARYCY